MASYLAQNFINIQDIIESEDLFFPIPGKANYEISIDGSVRHVRNRRILKTRIQKSSVRYYVVVPGVGRQHRLLMTALVGRSLTKKELILHTDGNTFNNAIENLRIGSHLENSRDRLRSNSYGSKLKNQDVREIRHLAAAGTSPAQIAAMFKISTGHVRSIIRRTSWRNLM